MGPRVYKVHDGADVPDLRAGSFSRPLSTRIKVAAAIFGAFGSFGGYAVGVGRWTVSRVDDAVTAVVRRENAPIIKAQQDADRLAAERAARVDSKLGEISAQLSKVTEAVARKKGRRAEP